VKETKKYSNRQKQSNEQRTYKQDPELSIFSCVINFFPGCSVEATGLSLQKDYNGGHSCADLAHSDFFP
jgi:hypothetical protein